MSFFSDLSPVGKGAVVLGAVVLLYLLLASVVGMAPFTEHRDVSHKRGVQGQDR
jgi:hypothetical protein